MSQPTKKQKKATSLEKKQLLEDYTTMNLARATAYSLPAFSQILRDKIVSRHNLRNGRITRTLKIDLVRVFSNLETAYL